MRGLDRFLSGDGLDTHEVLVSPEAALPVEVNTLRDGALRARTELRYEVHGTIGHVRQFMRNEQTVAGQTSSRVIAEVELTNVAIATGGAQ